MSAWLCSDIHLSVIIQAAAVEGIIDHRTADYWWREAKWQNLYALHCRYGDALEVDGEQVDQPQDIRCNRTSVEAPLRPDVVVRAIEAWDYQCSEFDGYDQTRISQLMYSLIARLKGDNSDIDFDTRDLPWGVDAWDQATHPFTIRLIPSIHT